MLPFTDLQKQILQKMLNSFGNVRESLDASIANTKKKLENDSSTSGRSKSTRRTTLAPVFGLSDADNKQLELALSIFNSNTAYSNQEDYVEVLKLAKEFAELPSDHKDEFIKCFERIKGQVDPKEQDIEAIYNAAVKLNHSNVEDLNLTKNELLQAIEQLKITSESDQGNAYLHNMKRVRGCLSNFTQTLIKGLSKDSTFYKALETWNNISTVEILDVKSGNGAPVTFGRNEKTYAAALERNISQQLECIKTLSFALSSKSSMKPTQG